MDHSLEKSFTRRSTHADSLGTRSQTDAPGLRAVQREINALTSERERIFAKRKSLPGNEQRRSRIKFILDARLTEIRIRLAALYARRDELSSVEKVAEGVTS
jgi:hypothetical protein